MVLRQLAMALLSLGVVLPGLTHALALREVKTQSALGEPFSAEIELSDLGDLTEEDIKVSLAQAEDFERLGLERVYLLAELRFQVVVKQGGRSYIKITSHKRMTEPFLDFIMRVSWPNNTRLQQVTALLDPPVSKVSRAQTPIAAPVIVQAAPPVIQPVVALTPPQAQEETPEEPTAERSYTVKSKDTLWNIARRVRPNTTVSVTKMMKVLHKANPDAFIANNINLLKNGQVLRVPSLMDTQTLDNSQLATQNTAIVPTQSANKPLVRQAIDATANAKPIEKAIIAPKVQMQLIAPKARTISANASSHHNSDIAPVGTKATPSATSRNTTHIKAAKTHNHQLSQELVDLAHQLKLNDKKIAMQNAKLAQLEAQLKARRLATEQAKQQDKKANHDKKAVATLACAVAMQSFLATDAKAAEETTATTTPAPAKEGGSMMPIVGGGILVVVIALIFFLKGKNKKEQQPPARPSVPPTPPAAPKPVATEAPKPAAATPVAPKPVEAPKPIDPLEEVRPYLEMERYPQAVGILTKALVQLPNRADIHLKLLEIFAKQKDRTAFETQYHQLEMLGDLDAIVAADKLKQQLPPEEVKPSAINKDGALEFTPSKAPDVAVVEEPSFSLDDLENEFKVSLSQPNLKALDIPLAPDPIELQRPEVVAPVVETATTGELDSLLEGGLAFKLDTPTPIEDNKALSSNLSFGEAVLELEETAKVDEGTGLSLDSLDDFLKEHQQPVISEIKAESAPTAELDFERELAKFSNEKQESAVEESLTEGFDLEEFQIEESPLSKGSDLEFDVSDTSFDIEEKTEEASLDIEALLSNKEASIDLSDIASTFDKEELAADIDLPEDLAFEDLSVSSEDVIAELDKEFSFLASTNENGTRLELARAYLEMGDRLGARDLLEEVVAEGDSAQKTEAQGILMRIA